MRRIGPVHRIGHDALIKGHEATSVCYRQRKQIYICSVSITKYPLPVNQVIGIALNALGCVCNRWMLHVDCLLKFHKFNIRNRERVNDCIGLVCVCA